ncbi:MAG: C39 family peptidase [Aggregatilineales bacterium]
MVFRHLIRGAAALGLLAVLFGASSAAAQTTTAELPANVLASAPVTDIPPSYRLTGIGYIAQTWNNCGPATLTMALSYYEGFSATPQAQDQAARWLKPNPEDKNVSPWQMAEYVNTQLDGSLRAIVRQGGTLDLLRVLIANNFPVMIEAGYDPPGRNLGWMGHYLLVDGYDDATRTFYTQDSYDGANMPYSYDHIMQFWRHFNYVYIVVYDLAREAELLALLGSNASERQNWINALEIARAEAIANPNDPFAWFNMGTNFVGLGMYPEAATAFDQARNVGGGLPWRMLWYQFGPFEAYLEVGRYSDVIALAQANLNDGGGHWVEETFYYAGLARAAMGERERALTNLDQAIYLNPNFTPAREARAAIAGT